MKFPKPMTQMRNQSLVTKLENLILKTRINIIPNYLRQKANQRIGNST